MEHLNFGYGEVYEWVDTSKIKYGVFLTFSKELPNKVEVINKDTKYLLGVSTLNYTILSDNSNYWHAKYLGNEIGDLFLLNDKVKYGKIEYDDVNEFSYLKVEDTNNNKQAINKQFDKSKAFIPREFRKEWAKVILLGKAIVYDDCKCKPGNLYGVDKNGYLVSNESECITNDRFYVIERVTEKTVKIILK